MSAGLSRLFVLLMAAGLAGPLGGFGHERPSGLTGCGCHRWCTS